MTAKLNTDRHPCFNVLVKGECGRVHLPVAPHCNIKCNYCNRKYDCVNESRPGVTSAVLLPRQALRYLEQVLAKEPRITVAGIAGPGDPLANPRETLETLRLVHERFPQLLICLATNGLALPRYVPELVASGVSHVTVTVNAVDPEVGRQMIGWVRDGKVIYRGRDAAELLLERQTAAIRQLKEHAVTVKINTIVVPGINDHHVEQVAAAMASLGADLLNCMPVYPNPGTPFAAVKEPDQTRMAAIREQAAEHLPQMHHCTRCRADAVGLLDDDRGEDLHGCLNRCALTAPDGSVKPFVAVATREGLLVNWHLGEAVDFQIWEQTGNGYRLVAERPAPAGGSGRQRWLTLAETLRDCRAVLVSGIGERPRQVLAEHGITPIEMNGFIEAGLEAVYRHGDVAVLKGRRNGCTQGGCKGDSGGCL